MRLELGLEPAFARNVTTWPPAGFQALPLGSREPGFVIPLGALRPGSREIPEKRYELTGDSSLDSSPAEPLDIRRTEPIAPKSKWSGATIAASIAFHAAVALCFIAVKDDGVKIAGADDAGIAMFGNAAENLQAAGDSADDGLPVTNVTLVTMLDAKPVQTVEAQPVADATSKALADAAVVEAPVSETVTPVEAASEQPESPISTATLAEPDLVQPVAEEILPPEDAPPVLAVEPTEPTEPEDEVDAVQQPSPVATLEPVEKLEEVAPLLEPEPAPPAKRVEQARKAEPRKVVEAAPQKRTEKPSEKPSPATASRSSGSRGNAALDARRGKADGQQNGSNGIKSQGGATGVGNAPVSNYPGKIVAKLKRMLRYPAQARRQGIRGETRVSFVVAADGSVGTMRVVGSSGSDILDEAALDAVRRAAPFPPIPESAGRSSWNFTVPLAFTR